MSVNKWSATEQTLTTLAGIDREAISQLEEEIAELKNGVSYTELIDKTNDLIKGNSLVFVHVTDTHIGYGMTLELAKKHASLTKKIADDVNADFILHTGDMIQGNVSGTSLGTDKECYSAYMPYIRGYVPFIFSHGNTNHDGGVTDASTPNGYKLSHNQVLSLTSRFGKSLGQEFNSDTEKTYYYVDFDLQKVRLIVLCTDDKQRTNIRYGSGISATQLAWVTSTLADAKTKGYSVICASHIVPVANLNYQNAEIENGTNVYNALKSFVDDGGNAIAWIHGHTHWDNWYYDADLECNFICMANGSPINTGQIAKGKCNLGNPHEYARSLDDDTQYCIDIYVINADNGTVNTVRFGVGNDRCVRGDNINYASDLIANTRLSSTGAEKAQAGTSLTREYIPITSTSELVSFENITCDASLTSEANYICFYDASKNVLSSRLVYAWYLDNILEFTTDDANNIKTVRIANMSDATYPLTGVAYMRFSSNGFAEDSKITISQ